MRGLVKRFFVLRGVCAAFFNNHYEFEWGEISAFFSWLVINVQFFSFLNEFVNFVIRSIVGLILWFDPIIFILATQTMKTLCDYLDIFHIAQLYFYYIHQIFFHQPQYLCKTIFIIDVLALFMFWHGFFPSFAVVLSLFLFSFFRVYVWCISYSLIRFHFVMYEWVTRIYVPIIVRSLMAQPFVQASAKL